MGLKFFDAGKAEEFGVTLAKTFSESYPEIHKKKEKSGLKKRVRSLGKLNLTVRQFGQANSMNFYKTAKLANAFKWTLLDAGYDAEFVEELTKEVILALK